MQLTSPDSKAMSSALMHLEWAHISILRMPMARSKMRMCPELYAAAMKPFHNARLTHGVLKYTRKKSSVFTHPSLALEFLGLLAVCSHVQTSP